ncbi:MAG: Uma2 family endonuclease [Verrucomicrobiota bacterium]
MAIAQTTSRLTEKDYLEIERAAPAKSEFFDGEMFAMAGGTFPHSLIGTNVAGEFRAHLKGKPCRAFNADLRVKVKATGLYTYPDLSVICGPPDFVDGEKDTITNPTLIVEVLSDSTEAYDRGAKFEHYRQMPSLREYLLVNQKEPRIEQFVRQTSGEWLLREASGLEGVLHSEALGISVSLREIFAEVEFPPSSLRNARPASPLR